jgi:hypothetical protein
VTWRPTDECPTCHEQVYLTRDICVYCGNTYDPRVIWDARERSYLDA